MGTGIYALNVGVYMEEILKMDNACDQELVY